MTFDEIAPSNSDTINISPSVLESYRAVGKAQSQESGSIEIKMREVLATLKGSKYPDTFDWGVYDKIASRFDDALPRGGVVFKTGLKLVNHHSSCSKCHYAFEIDTYGRGCLHNCVYCYAKEILTRHGYWNEPRPFPLDLSQIRKIFFTVFETQKPSKWRSILESRVPLRIGSMSDSFMWMDLKYKVTLELLKILKFYRYPHIIFTRSDLIAHEDYIDAMDPQLTSVQFSISGGNEKIARQIEPGAPSVKRRLDALKILGLAGFWTAVRINPLFPIYPDGYFTDQDSVIERFGSLDRVPKFDLFDWDFIPQLREHNVRSVLAGFVRLSRFAIRSMSTETGIDFSSFFKPELYSKVTDSRYSDAEVGYYYKQIKKACDEYNVRFSTCFIGMGLKDYFQYQPLWNNKRDCCDVRGNVPAFKTTSQDIDWTTRIAHAPSKADAVGAKLQEEEIEKQFRKIRPSLVNRSIQFDAKSQSDVQI